jgi:TonB family protein
MRAMHTFLLTAVAVTFAIPALAKGIRSTSSQYVRFSQQTLPNVIVPPAVLTQSAPSYTVEAARHDVEGTVVVQAQFDEYGNARALKVVKGLGYGLDENAVAALKTWRFSPALRNGLPVSAIAEIGIPFALQKCGDGSRN